MIIILGKQFQRLALYVVKIELEYVASNKPSWVGIKRDQDINLQFYARELCVVEAIIGIGYCQKSVTENT